MNEQESQRERRQARTGRDTLLGLARRPATQLILVVTIAAQVVSLGSRSSDEASEATAGTSALVEVGPAGEMEPDSALRTAWLEQAVAREADRLASEYRGQGFSVSPQLARQISEAAVEFEIEPEVAFGLIKAESSFRNAATSQVGAIGLMQLMPRTAAWVEPGVTRAELRDPETNLRVGLKYLRYLMDKYEGDERLALLAYNRGPGTVDRALQRGGNPDNGYADFVYGKADHGHRLFTR
ncbi:MAG: lytic transglycosylase domain-containing protein [Gemmatimonadota bacterium]